MKTVDSLLDFHVLDYLAYRCACRFVSELRGQPVDLLVRIVEQIPEEAFSPHSWANAWAYLTEDWMLPRSADKKKLMAALREMAKHAP